MRVQNKIDRYNLVIAALEYLPQLGYKGINLMNICRDKLRMHHNYIREYGTDMDEVKNWYWK